MADKLLGVRGGEPVGRHWDERFVTRSGELKMAFNRAKDRQRILQDNPETISAWFKLVEDTKPSTAYTTTTCTTSTRLASRWVLLAH
jgi:hypothetical protein